MFLNIFILQYQKSQYTVTIVLINKINRLLIWVNIIERLDFWPSCCTHQDSLHLRTKYYYVPISHNCHSCMNLSASCPCTWTYGTGKITTARTWIRMNVTHQDDQCWQKQQIFTAIPIDAYQWAPESGFLDCMGHEPQTRTCQRTYICWQLQHPSRQTSG